MFSPSSIADFLACRHLGALNRAYKEGKIKKPYFEDPGVELLRRLGGEHEERYLKELTEERGLAVVSVPGDLSPSEGARGTIEAMRAGPQVIYQARFLTKEWGKEKSDRAAHYDLGAQSDLNDKLKHIGQLDKLEHLGQLGWYGRADFLLRVEKKSALGDWSYEVVETKLARSTKARAIIQLCFYSDLVGEIQGVLPTYMHVVLGGKAKPERFAVQCYLAYFRKIKNDFLEAQSEAGETYPEPVEHCRVCDWSTVCDKQWRKDDHLSLIANITRQQREALVAHGTETVAELARMAVPPEPRVEGIKDQTFSNIQQQARLQVQGREESRNVYELLLPPEVEKGLCSLPAPSEGDVFLDFEGDALTFEGGLEYLFGVVSSKRRDTEDAETQRQAETQKKVEVERKAEAKREVENYEATWAMNPSEEKQAFEKFIDMVMERRQRYPDMHVYHYGAYEETAIKRMAGQHSTRVDEVDELLRGEVLVDLYRAVRQGLRASVESYSIKKLEPFYQYDREVNLRDASRALTTFQTVLAFGSEDTDVDQLKRAIEGYNGDDCVSTLRLRDWLEQLRTELAAQTGQELPRPSIKNEAPSENLSEYLQRVRAVEQRLNASLPKDKESWNETNKAIRLLADLLEWHRREDKSKFWEYFHRCDFSDEEFITDRSTLGGLVHLGEVEKVKKSTVHRYRFPFQDTTIERALELHDPRTKERPGEFHAIDYESLAIDLKRGPSLAEAPHPTALVPHDIVNVKVLRESLLTIVACVADNGLEGDGSYAAARELLLRHAPRLTQGTLADFQAVPSLDAAKQIVFLLDRTVLPIQGPPGSGKTFTGARMILELIRKNKKVGVTAVSHKVISNLLKAVCEAAAEDNESLRILQKCDSEDGYEHGFVDIVDSNQRVEQALGENEHQVIAGTVWLWSRLEMAESVDVLFVDEAGQMSLANMISASPAARSIVLLGDPQQLDQPQQGVHPPGAEVSALAHLLNGKETIEPTRGLFLAESWRLHPDICAFTSDVFYESRLTTRPDNVNQRIKVEGPLGGTGLRFVAVEHKGNESDSPEEVAVVKELIETLLRLGSIWTNKQGEDKQITLDDILVVAPYNAQVSLLLRSLPQGARVGTVDKFQGQEAPVVIYSMATSTPEDAPRGMEFLYSSNRLNVATSRAQCVTVLVASPALFDVQCKTPKQMELANAFCRYLEMARVVPLMPRLPASLS